MLTQDENETLTRVGPGTPMGELMRRYWVPALLSWEVPEPDCPPVDDQAPRRGARRLPPDGRPRRRRRRRCAHRRANLFWGRNEENGLRCVYHGWKFDCEGACVDMPSEPEETNFKDKVEVPRLPDRRGRRRGLGLHGPAGEEAGAAAVRVDAGAGDAPRHVQGLAAVQLAAGPRGRHRQRPQQLPARRRPASGGLTDDDGQTRRGAPNFSKAPSSRSSPTDYGYTYAGIRGAGGGRQLRPRLPLGHALESAARLLADAAKPTVHGHMWVPIDDENTMVYNCSYTYGPEPLL